jgi:hypothetical protein
MKINLHIERLVLDEMGLHPGHEKFLKAAMESELLMLLKDQGLGSDVLAGGARRSMAVSGISLDSGYSSRQLGRQIAQSVHEGLRK